MEDVVVKESKVKVLAIVILIFIWFVISIACTIFIFSLHDTLKNEIIDRFFVIMILASSIYFLIVWCIRLFHQRIIMIIGKDGVDIPVYKFIPWSDVISFEVIEESYIRETGRGSSYTVYEKNIKIYVRHSKRYRLSYLLIAFQYANMHIGDVIKLMEKAMKEYQKRNEGKVPENDHVEVEVKKNNGKHGISKNKSKKKIKNK